MKGTQTRWAARLGRWFWREWVRPMTLPVLGILAAKSALGDINRVPSGSMKPTILEGDVVFVNKLAYDLKVPFTRWRLAEWATPARGDIVVCFSPEDGTRLVKRVVALPGDTVEMRNEVLVLNGEPLRYSGLDHAGAGVPSLEPQERAAAVFATETIAGREHRVMALPGRRALRNWGPVNVPEGQCLVLGDNRDNSHDSRFFGFMPLHDVVGRAEAVFVSGDPARWLKPRLGRFCTALE